MEKIGDAVRNALPDSDIGGYVLSGRPDLSYQVMMQRRLVYVDQYSGQVPGTVSGGMDFLGFAHQLPLRLALLDKGREFGEMTKTLAALR